MSEIIENKRESTRIFFNTEEGINAVISSHNEEALSIPVAVLSLSCGGLSILGAKEKLKSVEQGDRLTICSLSTPLPLGPINLVQVKVAYVLDYEYNKDLSMGCEFSEVPVVVTEKIDDYVQYRLDSLGESPA
ncbi:MAG: hypothetical protein GY765_32190 [bacterium]|nr:hypothetical protein [bacterium]